MADYTAPLTFSAAHGTGPGGPSADSGTDLPGVLHFSRSSSSSLYALSPRLRGISHKGGGGKDGPRDRLIMGGSTIYPSSVSALRAASWGTCRLRGRGRRTWRRRRASRRIRAFPRPLSRQPYPRPFCAGCFSPRWTWFS